MVVEGGSFWPSCSEPDWVYSDRAMLIYLLQGPIQIFEHFGSVAALGEALASSALQGVEISGRWASRSALDAALEVLTQFGI